MNLKEAAKYLQVSEKTLSRYLKRGFLAPEQTRSERGTLEYSFLKEDLDAFKDGQGQTGQQTTQDTQERTHKKDDFNSILIEQIRQKDRQIAEQSKSIDRLTALLGMAEQRTLHLPAPDLKPKFNLARFLLLILLLGIVVALVIFQLNDITGVLQW